MFFKLKSSVNKTEEKKEDLPIVDNNGNVEGAMPVQSGAPVQQEGQVMIASVENVAMPEQTAYPAQQEQMPQMVQPMENPMPMQQNEPLVQEEQIVAQPMIASVENVVMPEQTAYPVQQEQMVQPMENPMPVQQGEPLIQEEQIIAQSVVENVVPVQEQMPVVQEDVQMMQQTSQVVVADTVAETMPVTDANLAPAPTLDASAEYVEETTPVVPQMPTPEPVAQNFVSEESLESGEIEDIQIPLIDENGNVSEEKYQPSDSKMVSESLEKNLYSEDAASEKAEPKEEPIEAAVIQEPLKTIDELWFSDLYFTPEKIAYVHDKKSAYGLKVYEAEDLMDFHKALEEGFQGSSSYSLRYGDSLYRIERIKTVSGIHYTARRMPKSVPDVYQLGMPEILVNHLTSLNKATGLILLCGPTGMGKTTTATALLRFFLENEGGFAYTIEDPPEMPMDGLYQARKGGLGLCKQTEVVNNNWELGLRSALRSKPRYILVGETRTAETAGELLRAATSGHLVISTIHANNLEDGLPSLIKYASASGMNEELASDLLARGILGVIHQKLTGTVKLRPSLHYCFANPDPMEADQMRMAIRDGKINLATLMEAQMAKMIQGRPLFKKI